MRNFVFFNFRSKLEKKFQKILQIKYHLCSIFVEIILCKNLSISTGLLVDHRKRKGISNKKHQCKLKTSFAMLE